MAQLKFYSRLRSNRTVDEEMRAPRCPRVLFRSCNEVREKSKIARAIMFNIYLTRIEIGLPRRPEKITSTGFAPHANNEFPASIRNALSDIPINVRNVSYS